MIAIIGPIVIGAGTGVLAEGIGTLLRPGAPVVGRNRPGDFVRLAQQLTQMRRAGLDPTVSSSPFTGDVVISTADQAPILDQLTLESFLREIQTPSPALSAAIFAARERFIEARRRTPPSADQAAVRAALRQPQPPGAARAATARAALFPRRAPASGLAVLR